MAPGKCIGDGGCGRVYAVRIEGKKCALKTFKEQRIFEDELRAYKVISTAPSLQKRVCGFLGTFPLDPRSPEILALCLARLVGPNLRAHLLALTAPEDREPLRQELHETLNRLHRDAGVVHGDISTENIIMEKGHPVLIDFSHARFRHDLDRRRWYKATSEDHVALDLVFKWADSEHATRAVNALVNGSESPDQQALARLLDTIECPCTALLFRIYNMFLSPTPTLALALADHLRRENTHAPREVALKLMLEGLARASEEQKQPCTSPSSTQPQPPPSSTPETRAMHRTAAFVAADLEIWHGICKPPGAQKLYRDALAAHEAACGLDEIDFLELRAEWAHFLTVGDGGYEESLAVCTGLLVDLESLPPPADGDWRFREVVVMLAGVLLTDIVPLVGPGEMKEKVMTMYWRARRVA